LTPNAFLATIGEGKKFVLFPKKQTIFAQGGPSEGSVSYSERQGEIDRRVEGGKEATIGISSEGDLLSPRVGIPPKPQGDPRVRHAHGELGAKAS
jgi:hypothetical protein